MKIQVVVELEVPDQATHYCGDLMVCEECGVACDFYMMGESGWLVWLAELGCWATSKHPNPSIFKTFPKAARVTQGVSWQSM